MTDNPDPGNIARQTLSTMITQWNMWLDLVAGLLRFHDSLKQRASRELFLGDADRLTGMVCTAWHWE